MRSTAPVRRPTVAARRTGYAVAAIINAAMLYAINVWPSWQAVPFLTEETRQVLWPVDLSVGAGVFVNLVYLAYDPEWLRSLGELVTTLISLAVLIRISLVFPFDFRGYSFDWSLLVRPVLIMAAVGTAIAAIVNFVSFVRRVAWHSPC